MSYLKYSAIGDLKRWLELEVLKFKWYKRNKHNDTTVRNIFDINAVEVGRYTYRYLYVMASDHDVKLKIGNYVSILIYFIKGINNVIDIVPCDNR